MQTDRYGDENSFIVSCFTEDAVYCEKYNVPFYLFDGSDQDEYDYNVNAIPLTEEWLRKFGFEKLQETYFNGDFELDITDAGFLFSETYIKVSCKYVHQLQNIYFALTGKELEVK